MQAVLSTAPPLITIVIAELPVSPTHQHHHRLPLFLTCRHYPEQPNQFTTPTAVEPQQIKPSSPSLLPSTVPIECSAPTPIGEPQQTFAMTQVTIVTNGAIFTSSVLGATGGFANDRSATLPCNDRCSRAF
ncbi:hypothetical protein NE237_024369 [Protea cynaroides]|uniref:Uncharacterized protein n=1 Tax=Protea cynaroides TaxID=273540 RepID=A0A9Q0K6R6_9MAGN|nr:hypothetical protein NE237_024369 [Protea cynaroides]